jgi:3-phenylpropionate/trans-cinnamate dioxygenase ferredoxin component
MSNWVRVGNISEIKEGSPISLIIDGTSIVVFKIKEEFFAIENICTHDGGELIGGCIDHDQIICPRHGARFSIKTGEALTAPAYEPIATFPLRIENEILEVRDDRWD